MTQPSESAASNLPPTIADTSFEDFAEYPHPYMRAMMMRLRIEMLSAVRALQGPLLKDFWNLVDELKLIQRQQEAAAAATIG